MSIGYWLLIGLIVVGFLLWQVVKAAAANPAATGAVWNLFKK